MAKSKMVSPPNKSDKRANIRFEPDPGTLAWLDAQNTKKTERFEPAYTALVAEESSRGCSVVTKMSDDLEVGALCRVKVGNSQPLVAEVRWKVSLDTQFVRLGLMYLE